jgi:hypothetical protein
MDLVAGGDWAPLLERRSRELQAESGAVHVTVFGTSIHDETPYKVRHPSTFCLTHVSRFRPHSHSPFHLFYFECLVTSAGILKKRLPSLQHATEDILFERRNFLVIATSTPPDDDPGKAMNYASSTRYERTSELIMELKHSWARMREEIHPLFGCRRKRFPLFSRPPRNAVCNTSSRPASILRSSGLKLRHRFRATEARPRVS